MCFSLSFFTYFIKYFIELKKNIQKIEITKNRNHKKLLEVLDNEIILVKTKLSIEKVKEIRKEQN